MIFQGGFYRGYYDKPEPIYTVTVEGYVTMYVVAHKVERAAWVASWRLYDHLSMDPHDVVMHVRGRGQDVKLRCVVTRDCEHTFEEIDDAYKDFCDGNR